MAQSFLETGKQCLFIACLDMDEAVRREAHLGKRRRKEIGTGHDPEYLPLRSGGDPRGKERRCCTIHRAVAASCDLVQSSKRQPSSPKPAVDLSHAKRQDAFGTPGTTFKVRDALLKLSDN